MSQAVGLIVYQLCRVKLNVCKSAIFVDRRLRFVVPSVQHRYPSVVLVGGIKSIVRLSVLWLEKLSDIVGIN